MELVRGSSYTKGLTVSYWKMIWPFKFHINVSFIEN